MEFASHDVDTFCFSVGLKAFQACKHALYFIILAQMMASATCLLQCYLRGKLSCL